MGDGVAIRMSGNVALTLGHLAGRLADFLEHGTVEPRRTGLLRRPEKPETVRRRMFPDAYRDKAEAAEFRHRHTTTLDDPGAPRLVQAQCQAETMHILSPTQVDDWIVTAGLARLLVLPRKGAALGMTGSWLAHVQTCLVLATDPDLVVPHITPHGMQW